MKRDRKIRDFQFNIFRSERVSHRIYFDKIYMIYRLWPLHRARIVRDTYHEHLYSVFRTELDTDKLSIRFLYTTTKRFIAIFVV